MNTPLLAAAAAAVIGAAAIGGYVLTQGGQYRLITYGGKAEDRVVANVTPVCLSPGEAETILNGDGTEGAGFKGLRWKVRSRELEPVQAGENLHLHGYVVTTPECAAMVESAYRPGNGYGNHGLIVEKVK